ncbi:uncharacterized protein P174DRAFT_228377 [Aspergillus novofumigatus IBT 16806]|uniref:Uncharacterized protein n=1 Tax=Aspergillus novofumigatus (strain IBT 16806) TaxID=1392255 RepID=A0A2I1C6P0_ASPN1|nr:uncharacterized protein P174DRAFT_228377 [Aspergillus novofumigatus IBT 16806]PKX93300.1 hypothetical protein P174DRAFT_228377 [Aspergillus novofumigatus IBT 16806]
MIHIHDVINHRISKLIEYSLALIVSQEPDGNDSLDCSLDRPGHTCIDTVAYHTLTTNPVCLDKEARRIFHDLMNVGGYDVRQLTGIMLDASNVICPSLQLDRLFEYSSPCDVLLLPSNRHRLGDFLQTLHRARHPHPFLNIRRSHLVFAHRLWTRKCSGRPLLSALTRQRSIKFTGPDLTCRERATGRLTREPWIPPCCTTSDAASCLTDVLLNVRTSYGLRVVSRQVSMVIPSETPVPTLLTSMAQTIRVILIYDGIST